MDNWIICVRCGTRWEVVKNKRRKLRPLCASCRVRPATVVTTHFGKCIPWHGQFAKDWTTPLDENGVPFLPGERLCKNLDCVNPEHVVH